jgi:hypothetical protein
MTKKITIPKIPQNLPRELFTPLDKLRQAIIELSAQVDQPIDARTQIKFGTVTEKELEPALLTDVNAVRYYIEPTNGTAIKNSVGTLTIRATKVDGNGTTFLSAGNIKMFKPDGSLAGNGYTWTADAADISDSIVITLKDSVTKVEWDTITLIDVTDGGDAVIGSIVSNNGLSWSRAIDGGAWDPVTTTTDLTCTFYQSGAQIATRVVRVTRAADGTMTAALQSNNGEATTHSVTGSGTTAITIDFTHTASNLSVAESVVTVQGGDSGPPGTNAATLTAYKRFSSEPFGNPGTLTYTFATAAWTPGNGWSATIPAGSDPLYALSATAYGTGATDQVDAGDWSSPTLILQDGNDGADGLNVATAYIYQRTATDVAPTLPSVSATYTFATGAITGLNNGWTDTIPAAGANPFLWVSLATASSSSATDAIGSGEWQAAQHLAEDGQDGAPGAAGINSATLTAYIRSASAPGTNPGTLTYTFATAAWTPGNGWSKTIPAGSDPLYARSATAAANTATDQVDAGDWSGATLILQDGVDGGDGLNVATVYIYQRTATDVAPTLPSATANYTFATGNVTGLNNGWTDTIPAAGSNPFLWVSIATASSTAASDNIGSGEWQAAQHLAEDGAAGTDGNTSHVGSVFLRKATAPTEPVTNDGSYNFTTGVLTPPSIGGGSADNWSITVPAGSNPLYVSTGLFEIVGTSGTDNTVDWTAPAILASDGAPGTNGDDGILHYLTNEAHVVVSNFDGGGYTLINAGGDHKVFDGTTDVTSSAVHKIVGGTDNGSNWTKVQNGLTLQVIEATGAYTLSGTSWASSEETFTIRATYGGIDYDKVYSIAKAKQGNDGGCAVDTLTGISLDDSGIGGTRTVGFRVDNNGNIYTRANNGSGYVSKETWIGACANTSYECNFVSSGSALTTGTANSWLPCSTDQTFELSRSTNGISSRSGTIQIRRTSDDVVVGSASASLRVERSL